MEQKDVIKDTPLLENNNSKRPYAKLDYTITDIQQRNRLVHEIVNSVAADKLTPYYLEELTRYLVETPESKKEKTVLTDNRMVTVNKRETSYQGLVLKLENGEDGIYNFMTGGDKGIYLIPKLEITEEDIETIPGLKELQAEIKKIEAAQKAAGRGKRKALLTKQLKQMRQEQYILKSFYKPPISMTKVSRGNNKIILDEKITIDKNGEPVSDGLINFFDPHHISCLLCNYSKLKEDVWGHFENDLYFLMQDFDDLIEKTFQDNPIMKEIIILKIDGLRNQDIAAALKKKFNITYTVEYLSVLWRKKIPKMIAEEAKKDWIVWHYQNEEVGVWKRCSRCHELKLAHPYFFTRNKSAKDGWYSMCKCCRNKK